MLPLADALHYLSLAAMIAHLVDVAARKPRPPVDIPDDRHHSVTYTTLQVTFFAVLLYLDAGGSTSVRLTFRYAFAWWTIVHLILHCIARNVRTMAFNDLHGWLPIIISGVCGIMYLPTAAYNAHYAACSAAAASSF